MPNYGQLLQQWTVELIERRARKKGFRPDEMDDLQQDLVPILVNFRFDIERSNGATETTVLTAVIDKQLMHIRRGHARRLDHETRYAVRCGRDAQEHVVESEEPRCALVLDVQEVLADLTPLQREICARLADDEARSAIARELGLSRYRIDREIERIRAQFEARGLNAWVQG